MLKHEIAEHLRTHRPTLASSLSPTELDQMASHLAERAQTVEAAAIQSGLNPDQARELSTQEWALPDEDDEPRETPGRTTD